MNEVKSYIKLNVLLSSYLDSWDVTNFKIYLGSSSKLLADMEKKRWRWKYKDLNISRTKRAFIVFEGLSFGDK